MDRVRAEEQLNAQRAVVQSAHKNVDAAQADLNTAIARTHQQRAAASNVAANEAQVANAARNSPKRKPGSATRRSTLPSAGRSQFARLARGKS